MIESIQYFLPIHIKIWNFTRNGKRKPQDRSRRHHSRADHLYEVLS